MNRVAERSPPSEPAAAQVIADVDRAPRGCMMFGPNPVLAEADAERATECLGCAVVCVSVHLTGILTLCYT